MQKRVGTFDELCFVYSRKIQHQGEKYDQTDIKSIPFNILTQIIPRNPNDIFNSTQRNENIR
jgi:hypothetical protein